MSASSSASAVPRLAFVESALGFVDSSSEGRSGFYPTAFPPDLLALDCLEISASSIDPPASATQLPLGPVAVVIGLLRPPTGVRYCTGRFAGFKRPRTDVGVTQTDGIHYFDLFAYLLGREATAVIATLRDHLGRSLDDCSFTTVEYGDVPAFVEAGYFAPGPYRDCVIVGENATLDADFGSSEVRVLSNHHVQTPSGWQAPEGQSRASRPRARSRCAGSSSSFSSRHDARPARRRRPRPSGRDAYGGSRAAILGAGPSRHALAPRVVGCGSSVGARGASVVPKGGFVRAALWHTQPCAGFSWIPLDASSTSVIQVVDTG